MGKVSIELEVRIAHLAIRQIASILNIAREYESDIQIRNFTKDAPFVNAAELLDMMAALQAFQGDVVELIAEGEDATEAQETGQAAAMKIIIVGGGPAGSLSAIRLLQEAERRGRELKVVIYESKPFGRHGPMGCNFCAGVITARTVEKLGALGIELPTGVIQRRIESFYYVTEGGEIEISRRHRGNIFSVFRGGGPRHMEGGPEGSFDGHLLMRAEELGAEIRRERVGDIVREGRDSICVVSGSGREEADLVLGAFGVNSGLPERLRKSLGYSPPPVASVAQAEFEMEEDEIERRFGRRIFAFALRHPRIRFIAITPKRRFITVTAVGETIGMTQLLEYLDHPRVAPFFEGLDPESLEHCSCSPRMPLGYVGGAVSHRFFAVGDAFASRYYKNGLGSALFSADTLAGLIMEHGPGREATRAYRSEITKRFRLSNRCGRILFKINDITHKSRLLSRSTLRYLKRERDTQDEEKRRLTNIMWSLFAGDRSYCGIMADSLRLGLLFRLALWHVGSLIGGVGRWLAGKR